MILPIYSYNITEYEELNASFTEVYGDEIYALITAQTNEEFLVGYSCKMMEIVQYRLAFMFGYILMMDYRTTNREWSYYVTKYNIEDKRTYLACSGINLDDLLELFGLPNSTTTDCSGGIGSMTIEGDCEECPFVIGATDICDSSLLPLSIDMSTILETYEDGAICESYFENC